MQSACPFRAGAGKTLCSAHLSKASQARMKWAKESPLPLSLGHSWARSRLKRAFLLVGDDLRQAGSQDSLSLDPSVPELAMGLQKRKK